MSNSTLRITPDSNNLHRQDSRHLCGCRQTTYVGLAEVRLRRQYRVLLQLFNPPCQVYESDGDIFETRQEEQTVREGPLGMTIKDKIPSKFHTQWSLNWAILPALGQGGGTTKGPDRVNATKVTAGGAGWLAVGNGLELATDGSACLCLWRRFQHLCGVLRSSRSLVHSIPPNRLPFLSTLSSNGRCGFRRPSFLLLARFARFSVLTPLSPWQKASGVFNAHHLSSPSTPDRVISAVMPHTQHKPSTGQSMCSRNCSNCKS